MEMFTCLFLLVNLIHQMFDHKWYTEIVCQLNIKKHCVQNNANYEFRLT